MTTENNRTANPHPADAAVGPLASPGYWLHHAALGWRRELGVRLKRLDLPPTPFDVLGSLSWQLRSGEVTQQMVADFAGIDRMMTSKIVRTLEQRELITRTAHVTDARILVLNLTHAGRAMVTEATKGARAIDRELFDSAANSRPLRRELATILERLEHWARRTP